jgi:hypothetical protein
MGLLKILPNTPLCRSVGEYGYRHCGEPPYAVLANSWLDHSTLSELYWFSECVEKFVNNRYFVSLWHYFRRRREDSFTIFLQLLGLCQAHGFFQLAPTHELLCTLLVRLAAGRDDRDLLLELLRYDWLRCGYRFLPDCLTERGLPELPEATRSALYQLLPMEMAGIYDRASRNQFFRKSFFLRISPEALREIGLGSDSIKPCLAILAEREKSLFGFNKAVVF